MTSSPKSALGNATIEQALDAAIHHHQSGALAEAESIYRVILSTEFRNATANHMLGVLLYQTGRNAESLGFLTKAMENEPKNPEIYRNLGAAYMKAGMLDDARDCFQHSARLDPSDPHAPYNLGLLLMRAGQHDEAASQFERALSKNPDYAEAHNNLGVTLRAVNRMKDAEFHLRRALELKPRHLGAMANLGNFLRKAGRLDESSETFRKALAIKPDHTLAALGLGISQLMAGDYAEGWKYYEVRRMMPEFAIRHWDMEPWDGGALNGRRLLVHTEQGIGDALIVCRYLERLQALDGEVVFEARDELVPLLRSMPALGNIEIVSDVPGVNEAEFDLDVPLMSLPHLVGPVEPFWPQTGPYVLPEPGRVEAWKDRLAGHDGPTIAIYWQGNPNHRSDNLRSIPLAQFEPLILTPNVRLISLQQGTGPEQIDDLPWGNRILHLGDEINQDGALLDTAAILANVDLMVTSDTGPAHLAGAMGVPVWTALMNVPEWRWQLSRQTTPWYPTMRLFRQPTPGDWSSVFSEIAAAAKERFA